MPRVSQSGVVGQLLSLLRPYGLIHEGLIVVHSVLFDNMLPFFS